MPKGSHSDRIVRIAAGLFDVPMAALCLSDGDDIRIAAAVGADTPAIERGLAAWGRRIRREGALVEPDLRDDVPSGDVIPAGHGHGFRFVAGIPLEKQGGEVVGILVVADHMPRAALNSDERLLLSDLARLAVDGEKADEAEALARERAAREAAERRLAEVTAALEREEKTRARFIAAANHDLRQPFQALHLFLHLLQGKLTDPAQRELADRIEEAVRNGEAMLTNLLDLTALEIGKTRCNPARIRLCEVLDRLVEEADPQAQAKGLRLRYVPTELEVETDPALLERLLRQLVANAIRNTAEGSVLIGARPRGDRAVVEVWDTGCGIPADQLERVFEPFVQVAGGASGDRGGRLGLGLTIVERTARLIGAEASLQSVPGRGTLAQVRLPRVRPEPVPAEAPSSHPAERLPVVVIEDDPVQLMAVRMILEGWGLTVVAAPTRERALAALQATTAGMPGLVLSDLRLRGTENGLDAVAALRETVGRAVPAILMTGDTNPEQVQATHAAGVHLLQKPFGPEHLRDIVERVTGWTLAVPS